MYCTTIEFFRSLLERELDDTDLEALAHHHMKCKGRCDDIRSTQAQEGSIMMARNGLRWVMVL
ncbi:MAG: hypothetical protein OJF47_001133 [Nitrospira sp.]|nr:MAG: hypothetical protein OJF47_001133 [Nitrospira sp.]